MGLDPGYAVLDVLSSSLFAAVLAGGERRGCLRPGPSLAVGPPPWALPLPAGPRWVSGAEPWPGFGRAAAAGGAAGPSPGPRPAARPEARRQLQAMVSGIAGCIESLERRLEVAVETLAFRCSCSPEKNTVQSQQLFLPDPSPRKSRASGSALTAKRKVPGESLINPGFKSKKVSSGVNFEDS